MNFSLSPICLIHGQQLVRITSLLIPEYYPVFALTTETQSVANIPTPLIAGMSGTSCLHWVTHLPIYSNT